MCADPICLSEVKLNLRFIQELEYERKICLCLTKDEPETLLSKVVKQIYGGQLRARDDNKQTNKCVNLKAASVLGGISFERKQNQTRRKQAPEPRSLHGTVLHVWNKMC